MNNRIINCYSISLFPCHLLFLFFQYPLLFFWQNPPVDKNDRIIIRRANRFSPFLLMHPICTPMMFSIARIPMNNSWRIRRIIYVYFRLNLNSFFDLYPIRIILPLHRIVYHHLLLHHHPCRRFLLRHHNLCLFVVYIEAMFSKLRLKCKLYFSISLTK